MEAITRHFAGWVNGMADDLSRQNLEAFLQKAREYGFMEPVRLEFDQSLHDLLVPLAMMVRDHKMALSQARD